MSVYQRLECLERIGIKLGLRNIKTILEALNQPQTSYRSILIAGTNGKGSTGAMLDKILAENGLKTGYYTSPHLINVRERIQINRQMISHVDFEGVLTIVFDAVDSLTAAARLETPPTYFEVLTASAFLWFQQKSIDLAVIEVGLGGRFDATNALSQNLSVITSIDFDHEEFLGRSLSQIAAEKAGILKPKVPAVSGLLPREAAEIVKETAERLDCKLLFLDKTKIQNLHLENGFPIFHYETWNCDVRVGLRGRHQAINAGIALIACDALQESGIEIRKDLTLKALNEVQWQGRLDLLQENPPVLLDCAHNPMGVRSLADFLNDVGWNKVVVLFSAMKDKKIVEMLSEISPLVQHMVLTRIQPFSRCASQDQLLQACGDEDFSTEFLEPSEAALELAKKKALESQMPLVIFGSIYLAGEILRNVKRET